ncbi:hypothetical protein BYT27DRAFT_6905479 [Phlegmacium glaucopus]|nr:hypothetical protein BYT27DRAFT_6905479 [Phlegmacium glaucopus]
METREDLHRITVGNVQDWQKLCFNYRRATLANLQSQILANDLNHETDALLAHIEQFIERTFSIARPNLRVNGQNLESLDESGREMEAFDETLDRRIWSLADNRIKWHTLIAERRRKVPTETERTVATLLGHHHKLDADVLPALSADAEEEAVHGQDDTQMQRIEQAMLETSAVIIELDQIISREHERGNRVKMVATEVKSLKP